MEKGSVQYAVYQKVFMHGSQHGFTSGVQFETITLQITLRNSGVAEWVDQHHNDSSYVSADHAAARTCDTQG